VERKKSCIGERDNKTKGTSQIERENEHNFVGPKRLSKQKVYF
jgi:hypothetical protein